MPENPLLPNAELRALYQLLQRADVLSSEGRKAGASRIRRTVNPAVGTEALLAATMLQLKPTDIVLPEPGDSAVTALALPVSSKIRLPVSPQVLPLDGAAPRLMLAAGLAAGLKRAGQGGLVLALCRVASAGKDWADAVKWAQEDKLPLVVAFLDPSGADAFLEPAGAVVGDLTWKNLQRVAGRAQLPVLSVDGQDAVAMYRVMQESVLRARAQAGPAVLWSVLPTVKELYRPVKNAVTPLSRLEEYLRVRRISLPPKRTLA